MGPKLRRALPMFNFEHKFEILAPTSSWTAAPHEAMGHGGHHGNVGLADRGQMGHLSRLADTELQYGRVPQLDGVGEEE